MSYQIRPLKFLAGVAAASAIALGLSGCGGGANSQAASDCKPAHEFSTIKEGILTVGVYELPPFISSQGEGGMSGVDPDIIRLIAEKECLTVKPAPANFSALVPSLQGGRLDVVLGDVYRTKERDKVVNLTSPVYLDQMGIVATEDGIDSVSQLEGKTVGTVDGYMWNPDLKKVLGDNLKSYPSNVNMYQDLKAGRIQAGIDSYGGAVYSVGNDSKLFAKKSQPDDRVGASKGAQAAFLVPKENKAMLDAFNADIEELRKDGTIAEILKKHGLDPSAANPGDPTLL